VLADRAWTGVNGGNLPRSSGFGNHELSKKPVGMFQDDMLDTSCFLLSMVQEPNHI